MFLQIGSILRQTDERRTKVLYDLPPSVYNLQSDVNGFFLEETKEMALPEKIYGSAELRASRVVNTFLSRGVSTGVHLNGQKGSGKTLLAKQVIDLGAKKALPTIVVNSSYAGEGFNSLMGNIKQPVIVLFDEFDKVYADAKVQSQLLTLLDGTIGGSKLFILTTNDEYSVSSFLKNRPGRIFYRYTYEGVDEQTITEYCKDKKVPEKEIKALLKLKEKFPNLNFDLLKAAVEEMLRYGETLAQVCQHINLAYEKERLQFQNVLVEIEGFEPIRYEGRTAVTLSEDWSYSVNLTRLLNLMKIKKKETGKALETLFEKHNITAYDEVWFDTDLLIEISEKGDRVFISEVKDIKLKLYLSGPIGGRRTSFFF
jgi:hypothetical protein